jgi:hypothetical protein
MSVKFQRFQDAGADALPPGSEEGKVALTLERTQAYRSYQGRHPACFSALKARRHDATAP